jgi:concanavalin A-like lectin/glucanase superfamily protein
MSPTRRPRSVATTVARHLDADGKILREEVAGNFVTTVGVDFFHQQCWGSSGIGSNGINYVALSADPVTETVASTTLSNEIVANGFSRAQGTFAHQAGSTTSNIAITFTATGTQVVAKLGLFTASSGGTMGHVIALSSATYTVGQQLVLNITVTFTETVPGHTLDASTLALWKMNDTQAGDYTLNDSGPNARNMTTETGISYIVPGPGAGKRARRITATTKQLRNSNVGGDAAAMAGNWTVKCWVYLDTISGTQAFFNYAGDGSLDTQATNYLMSLRVDASGVVRMFWEQGAGVNVDTGAPSGTVTAAAWHLIAAVKENDSVNIGKKKLTFYLDGASLGSVSNLTNADGGTLAQWHYGASLVALTGGQVGNARAMMVTSDINSAATIAADFARTTGDDAYSFLDGNIIVYYECDELPDCLDENNLYHLRRLDGNTPAAAGTFIIGDPLINDGGLSRFMDNSTAYQTSTYLNESMRQAVLNSWTFECWIRGGDNLLAAQRGLFNYGGDHSTEVASSNYAALDILIDGTMRYNIEHDAGVNTNAVSLTIFDATNKFRRHHFAFVKTLSGGLCITRWYLDGAQVGADTAGIVDFNGGTAAWLWLCVGDTVTSRLLATIDDIRISNVARTSAEILADYQAGA